VGASHQTGWSGLIALLMASYGPAGTAQTAGQTLLTSDLVPADAK